MERSKGLIILLAILFISIFLGYFLIRINPNYPAPGNIDAVKPAELTLKDKNDWMDYVPPGKSFKVKLPALPQTTSKTIADPSTNEKRNYEVYVSEKKDGAVFVINIITFPDLKSNSKDDEMLAEVANDMMTRLPDDKLIKTEPGKFKGYPSLTFTIANDQLEIHALTFINGKTLYVLTRAAPKELADKGEFNFFINSFELKPRS